MDTLRQFPGDINFILNAVRFRLLDYSPNSTCCVTSRHVTSHDSLSSQCVLVQEKVVRAASRMLYSKCDTSVTTSATSAIRNLVCFDMYEVMIAVIHFNKRIN